MRKTYEEELAERAERYKLLQSTGTVVAKELGAGWSVERRDSNEYDGGGGLHIVNVDGRSMYLSVASYGYKGKVDISGDYDYGDGSLGLGWPYGVSRPGISVGLERGGAVIAKEIQRRFLPGYDAVFSRIAKSVREATEYRDMQEGICARLAVLAGAEPKRTNKRDFALYSGEISGRYLEAKISGGEVDIKLENLTEAQAGEVIRLVLPYLAKRKGGG